MKLMHIVLTVLMVCSAGYGVTVTGLVPDDEGAASNNVTAIRNAIAAAGNGGTVIIPAGVYYIDNNISFAFGGHAYNDVTIEGYGATLKWVSTGSDAYLMMRPGSGWAIKGLTLDGNRFSDVPNWSFGISCFYDRSDILIQDVTVKNIPYDGILVSSESGNVTIDNCTITDNHRQGVAIVDTIGGCVIKNSYFANNQYNGLDIEPDAHNTTSFVVDNCTFDGDDNLNLWGSSYGPGDVEVKNCNFLNGADLVGNRIAGGVNAHDNTFTGGGAIIFNSLNDNTEGLGKIALANNSIAGVVNEGVDLVANGGFETFNGNTPTSWTVVSTGTTTVEPAGAAAALAGNDALHLVSADASSSVAVQQTIAATAGAYYTYGYYLKRSSGAPMMKVEFLDGGSAVVGTQKLLARLTDEYEKVMGIAQAPTGTTSIRISIGDTSAGAFDATFDEVFLFKGIGPDNGDLTPDEDAMVIQSWKFDFDDNDPNKFPYLTAPGFTSVRPDTLYSEAQGYGFVATGALNAISDSTTVTFDPLYRDSIECVNAGDYFRVDVPNGRYYVTVALGSPSYNRWEKVRINGVDYHWATNPAAPPYDVEPDDGSIKVLDTLPDPHVLADVKGDGSRAGSYDQIQVRGWNGTIPIDRHSEVLYIDRTQIDVTNGHIDIEPTATTGNRWLCMVVIERLAPQTCADVRAMGLINYADLNEDCYVNWGDFSIFADEWLLCNDPQDPNCSATWLP